MTPCLDHRPQRSRTARLVAALGAASAGMLLASGCSGPGTEEAGTTAATFERLVVDDVAGACALLAPGTRDQVEKEKDAPCAESLADVGLPDPSPPVTVDVYGHDAIVRLGTDTVFLARFAEGWRVTAAGCRVGPREDAPYDCDVAGG